MQKCLVRLFLRYSKIAPRVESRFISLVLNDFLRSEEAAEEVGLEGANADDEQDVDDAEGEGPVRSRIDCFAHPFLTASLVEKVASVLLEKILDDPHRQLSGF